MNPDELDEQRWTTPDLAVEALTRAHWTVFEHGRGRLGYLHEQSAIIGLHAEYGPRRLIRTWTDDHPALARYRWVPMALAEESIR